MGHSSGTAMSVSAERLPRCLRAGEDPSGQAERTMRGCPKTKGGTVVRSGQGTGLALTTRPAIRKCPKKRGAEVVLVAPLFDLLSVSIKKGLWSPRAPPWPWLQPQRSQRLCHEAEKGEEKKFHGQTLSLRQTQNHRRQAFPLDEVYGFEACTGCHFNCGSAKFLQ